MRAAFQSEGKTPVTIEQLKILQIDSAIIGSASLTSRQGILSSPVALLAGKMFNC